MRTEIVERPFGVKEVRFYDDDGRLVEKRKKHPADIIENGVRLVKFHPGVSGGHDD